MEPIDAEHRHYLEVVGSFRDYANWMAAEANRREKHLAALPAKWSALLPSSALEPKAAALREAIAVNAAFLDAVASEQDVSGLGLQFQRGGEHAADDGCVGHDHNGHGHGHGSHHGGPPAAAAAVAASDASPSAAAGSGSSGRPTSSFAHYSKVRSTLHQCVRDWAAEGAPERDASYGPLITELQRLLPVNAGNVNAQRVLVPGCGLGRLLYELCARGYAAQGNEFSFQMLFTAHVILNVLRQKEAAVIHPFIHDASNHLRPEDMLRAVRLPDVVPALLTEEANPGADMSMTAGEFVEIYSKPEHAGAFDAVATCFFIDTAPVAMEYIDVIKHVLRPGGVWVNCGPLSFHWQSPDPAEEADASSVDARYGRSVELCYSEVRHAIIASGFKIVKEGTSKSMYASDRLSLSKLLYTAVTFSAIKQ